MSINDAVDVNDDDGDYKDKDEWYSRASNVVNSPSAFGIIDISSSSGGVL